MLDLATLIWVDDQYDSSQALRDCIGDRYLCAQNMIFAAVRAMFLSAGFQYSSDPSRLWRDYNNGSLFFLQDIIEERTVPYRDNLVTLKRVLARNPSLTISANNLINLVNRNYLLHESAHCIAHRCLSNCKLTGAGNSPALRFVLTALLCEAFANTVEQLAASFADSGTHVLYYRLNSYVQCRQPQLMLLRESLEIVGLKAVFDLAFLAYLRLNVYAKPPDELTVNLLIDETFANSRPTRGERALLGFLVSSVFTLREDFVTETTPLFFRQFGCEAEYRELTKSEFNQLQVGILGAHEALAILSPALVDNVHQRAESDSAFRAVASNSMSVTG